MLQMYAGGRSVPGEEVQEIRTKRKAKRLFRDHKHVLHSRLRNISAADISHVISAARDMNAANVSKLASGRISPNAST